jgi:uncharacterized protein
MTTPTNPGLRLIALDKVVPKPWRNGGGRTRELLAWPDPADWQLRISVADVGRDGPFSPYPGVERWFAVVEGAGVALQFADRSERLDEGSVPLRFDGALAPDCRLLDGATRDLNVMLRHGRCRGAMIRARTGEDWLSTAPLRVLFSAVPAGLRIDGADPVALPAGTLAVHLKAAGQCWRLASDGNIPRAWWIEAWPEAAR